MTEYVFYGMIAASVLFAGAAIIALTDILRK
jgi:hypothetical protein